MHRVFALCRILLFLSCFCDSCFGFLVSANVFRLAECSGFRVFRLTVRKDFEQSLRAIEVHEAKLLPPGSFFVHEFSAVPPQWHSHNRSVLCDTFVTFVHDRKTAGDCTSLSPDFVVNGSRFEGSWFCRFLLVDCFSSLDRRSGLGRRLAIIYALVQDHDCLHEMFHNIPSPL